MLCYIGAKCALITASIGDKDHEKYVTFPIFNDEYEADWYTTEPFSKLLLEHESLFHDRNCVSDFILVRKCRLLTISVIL